MLLEYLKHVQYSMSLFDVSLHYHFYDCSQQRDMYDLRNLFKNTLVEKNPIHTVTFVDNHDTQPGQALASFVKKWFKLMAYACILLRAEGYLCVFYDDYYGLIKGNYNDIGEVIDLLLWVRKELAIGWQNDYFEDDYQLGWTREGGMACLFFIRKKD